MYGFGATALCTHTQSTGARTSYSTSGPKKTTTESITNNVPPFVDWPPLTTLPRGPVDKSRVVRCTRNIFSLFRRPTSGPARHRVPVLHRSPGLYRRFSRGKQRCNYDRWESPPRTEYRSCTGRYERTRRSGGELGPTESLASPSETGLKVISLRVSLTNREYSYSKKKK